ncbi:MAG: DUF3488 and transglutaminase-like domain-containing protein [Clostridiales Family XIII bacterium]|jgi:hypothetical protein|nr:DUF3488 and transglutaminase-like domain-containing protein [Clostridiales Family XIII bacterium]
MSIRKRLKNAHKVFRDSRKGNRIVESGVTLGKPGYSEAEPARLEIFVVFAPLMLLGMLGAASSFYSVFRVHVDVGALVVFIVCTSVGVTALYISKHCRAILLAVLATLGAIAAVCLLSWERLRTLLLQGALDTLNVVISTYESRANVDFSLIPVEQLGEDEIRLSSTVFVMSLSLLVTLILGWILVRRRSAFFAFLLTVPFPAAALAYTIIPDYKSLMVIGLYWLFLFLFVAPLRGRDRFFEKRSRRAGARSVYIDGGRLSLRSSALVVIPVLALCLILVATIFSSESYVRPQVSNDLRSGIVNGNLGFAIFRSGGVAGNTNRVDLRHAGNLRYRNETAIRVKSTKGVPDYLKGFVGSVYTGAGWEQLPESATEELSGLDMDTRPQNYAATLFDIFNIGFGQEDEPPYELTVENVNINPRCVYAPYGLSSTPGALEGITFVSDGFLRSSNNMSGLGGYTLDAISVPPYSAYFEFPDFAALPDIVKEWLSPEQTSFFERQSQYNAFVYEHYTELPDGLKATLNEYLDERGLDPANYPDTTVMMRSSSTDDVYLSRRSPVDFILDVVRQVQSENAYTRSPGQTPEGRDFVEYFLAENHQGYCVHFATAVAALLRSVDIPARYAEGFVVSPDDPKTEDGWTALSDSRAHAWVEVYVSGMGWMPVEATPGRQSGVEDPWRASAIGLLASEAPTPVIADATSAGATSGPATSTTAGAATGDAIDSSGGGRADEAGGSSSNNAPGGAPGTIEVLGSPVTLPAIAAILALIILAHIVRRRRVLRRKRCFEGEDRKQAVLAAYAYIEDMLAFMGEGEHPEESEGARSEGAPGSGLVPRELTDIAMEARFSRHEPTQDALGTLLAYADGLSARAQREAAPLRRLLGRYVYGLF